MVLEFLRKDTPGYFGWMISSGFEYFPFDTPLIPLLPCFSLASRAKAVTPGWFLVESANSLAGMSPISQRAVSTAAKRFKGLTARLANMPPLVRSRRKWSKSAASRQRPSDGG